MKSKINLIIISLIILELILTSYIIYENKTSQTDVCIIGSNCENVQNSQYSSILGIKLTYIAITAFLILLILLFANSRLFLYSSAIGALFALYLVSIQLFVLKQICSTCMIIDFLMIIIFALVFKQTSKK